jgi:acyl-CoA dehydrogenase
MSEMRDLMLRSLDRIVDDTLDINARVAADSSGVWPEKLWAALEEQGMTAIGEVTDGDLGFADSMALVQRAAFHAVPVPLGETVLARRLLGRARLDIPEGALTVVAPGIASGVALSGGKLSGAARGVPWGRMIRHAVLAADDTLVLADISGATTEQGVNMADEPRDMLDLGRARAVGSARMDGATRAVEEDGGLLRAVQLSGALSRVLEHSLTWTGDRVQFGKPISKFQAIQHLMAQLAAETAAASAATDMAVEASVSAPNRFAIAIAKARAGEAAGKGAAIAHQAFGAMGFTREHQLQYATRRLWSWRDEFGGEAYWQADLGRTIATKGAGRLWATLTEQG